MKPFWWDHTRDRIHEVLNDFTIRIASNLSDPIHIFYRANPYLLRIRSDGDKLSVANSIVSSHITKSAQTVFGNKIEEIAICVCDAAKGGRKSGIRGIDLEYDHGNLRHIVSIKSGENWGNSAQRSAMKRHFNEARQIIGQNKSVVVQCVEGITAGRSLSVHEGSHVKLVGREFWKEISDWEECAREVFNIVGDHAGNGLLEAHHNAINGIIEFLTTKGVVYDNDKVDWNKLFELAMEPREPRSTSIRDAV